MTQAMTLANLLRKHGHEVVRVVVGRSGRRELPEFFVEGIGAPVTGVLSPNFVTDKNHKSVDVPRSVLAALGRLGAYRKSIRQIHQLVKADKPDVIINFYDFIGGLYVGLKRPKARYICVAHQYLLGHKRFTFPKGRFWDKRSLLMGNALTSWGTEKRLCLSFVEWENQERGRLVVVPPLIREEVTTLNPTDEGHVLAYMVNHGYSVEVERFHEKYPEVPLHCFWDNPYAPTVLEKDATLTFHRLDGPKFLKYMASCKGYLTTAGFESVCEAMYLGKPVLMMPVEGHYEQACNALDGQLAGAGIASDTFDLGKLLEYIPRHQDVRPAFRAWVHRSEDLFINGLIQEKS
jgi:uncharacterized protein (TIGR00661 family)